MSVIDVESRFDRWAVSHAGAVGLMQIMPFWPRELGMTNEQLVRIPQNIRMGCTILRFYLDREKGDYARALARYQINLQTARINTLGDRVEDVFLVSGEALGNTRKVLQLEQELLKELQI